MELDQCLKTKKTWAMKVQLDSRKNIVFHTEFTENINAIVRSA